MSSIHWPLTPQPSSSSLLAPPTREDALPSSELQTLDAERLAASRGSTPLA